MKSLFESRILALFVLVFMISACNSDADYDVSEEAAVDAASLEIDLDGDLHDHSNHPAVGFEHAINQHVADQGINLKEVEEVDFYYPDGSSEKKYRIEGDIIVSQEEMNALNTIAGEVEMRQYRTSALVSNNQTITVRGYTGGGGYGLTNKMRTALNWAVNNYNALNTGLNFSLSFGTSTNAEIVVYRVPNGQAGGQAGFPSGGNPYKWVQIFSGMDSYNTNVVEHVITHEIGHSMGLRHTDYFSRVSCGQNTNEGSGGVGAIHIPGTPTGVDWNSIMLACFSSGEDGEFGFYDRVALEYLY